MPFNTKLVGHFVLYFKHCKQLFGSTLEGDVVEALVKSSQAWIVISGYEESYINGKTILFLREYTRKTKKSNIICIHDTHTVTEPGLSEVNIWTYFSFSICISTSIKCFSQPWNPLKKNVIFFLYVICALYVHPSGVISLWPEVLWSLWNWRGTIIYAVVIWLLYLHVWYKEHECWMHLCMCFSDMEQDRHWISLEILIQAHPTVWFPWYTACSVMGPVLRNPFLASWCHVAVISLSDIWTPMLAAMVFSMNDVPLKGEYWKLIPSCFCVLSNRFGRKYCVLFSESVKSYVKWQ